MLSKRVYRIWNFYSPSGNRIGAWLYIGAYNIIGTAKICDHATIASNVSILSGKNQHGFKEIGKPIQQQGGEFRKISIGGNSWIGNGAIIMDDIGIQNVIAAGSVLTKKKDDYVIMAGNPSKVVQIITSVSNENHKKQKKPKYFQYLIRFIR